MKAGFLTVGLYIAYLAVSAIPLVMAGCAISRYKIDGTIFRSFFDTAEQQDSSHFNFRFMPMKLADIVTARQK
ncbi:hypothetical protein X798_01194 [Onchocerca flexuosa]|uniref:Uncharacterized protein n=1 Tax=Onchocerca flexuosa TaxID=387005 RepID=A0A238C3H4_9BILA|nr:hypothetical protein X798_01194 [Onchocerca flexuosa]